MKLKANLYQGNQALNLTFDNFCQAFLPTCSSYEMLHTHSILSIRSICLYLAKSVQSLMRTCWTESAVLKELKLIKFLLLVHRLCQIWIFLPIQTTHHHFGFEQFLYYKETPNNIFKNMSKTLNSYPSNPGVHTYQTCP